MKTVMIRTVIDDNINDNPIHHSLHFFSLYKFVYNILHLEIYLYLMYLTSYCFVWCREYNYLSVQGFFTMNENPRKLSQFRVALEARGDGKCYFPCSDCRGLQRRRILTMTAERH